MAKKIHTAFRTAEETKAALEKAAVADGRTMSLLIDRIIVEWLKRHGWLTKKGPKK